MPNRWPRRADCGEKRQLYGRGGEPRPRFELIILYPRETGSMKPKSKKKLDLTKVRTRYEPPTLEEAIFAAQGLTSDIEHQIKIASELTGRPEDDVRQIASRMRPSPRPSDAASFPTSRPPVVVEKRSLRAFAR